MILGFDDGSETDLNLHPELRKAMQGPFQKFDPAKVEILLAAGVDWFHENRLEPDSWGQAVPWSRPYATKGELGLVVVQRLLHFQVQANLQGAQFSFRLQDQDTSLRLRGEPAVKKCNELTRAYLLRYGTRGLLSPAMKLVQAGDPAAAREAFEGIVGLLPEEGQAWFWLGILLTREGDAARAKEATRRAAELLASPYLDRAACPSCGWIPCGQGLWKCEGCGSAFDPFEARGECPKCAKVQAETACLACRKKSPPATWWKE